MASRTVRNLRVLPPDVVSIEDATRRFLRDRDLTPGSRRVYGDAFGHLAQTLGADTPLREVSTDDLEAHLVSRWGNAAPSTFNRNLAIVQSLFRWAVRRGFVAADPTATIERRRERRTARQADVQRAIPYPDLDALWSRKEVARREKTFWRMLYETAARADEILGLNIDDLDLAERSARIKGKGGHVEHVYWATATARLLPRLLDGRTAGPVFLTDRRPRTPVAKADVDLVSGRSRLSYRRAAELFTAASGGWTLHQLRHSALSHLADEGVDTALLKAKSRHRSLRSLERYVRPSDAAVARLTAEHDRSRRRR